MKTLFSFIIISFIIMVNTFSEEDEYIDTVLPECSFSKIEQCFSKDGFSIYSFEDAYSELSLYYCKIDTATLIKSVIRILSEENINKVYTGSERRKYRAAWNIALNDNIWRSEIEHIVEKQIANAKKNKNFEGYYGCSAVMVRKSANWFYYAMEVYNTEDTTIIHRGAKNMVFMEAIKRFNESTNPAELAKVESILYAVLLKDTYFISIFDEYLQKKYKKYKNSKQRLEIMKLFLYEYKKYREHGGFTSIFKYIDGEMKYLKELKQLQEYIPPISID